MSALSNDVASCHFSSSLAWSRYSVQQLMRAASFHCNSRSRSRSATQLHHHNTAPTPQNPSPRRKRSYVSRDAAGWGMVPVLNELLDVTASQQHRRRLSSSSLLETSSTEMNDDNRQPKRKTRCRNCQRTFSLVHEAASRPQNGYCSLDCRASHEYMGDIDADLDGLVMKTSFSSTWESTYSPVESISHLTFVARP